MKYERPNITLISIDVELLQYSHMGPGATDIGAPNVSNECKSIWDEVNEQYNIKEEQDYENWE